MLLLYPFSGTIVHNVYNVNSNFRIDPFIWTLFFDGFRSKYGAGTGCALIDPSGTKTMIACRLEFKCTKSIAGYEALVQGLKKSIDMGEKVIECMGDFEIIVKQVRNQIHLLSPCLINYQKLVRYLTNSFLAFNNKLVPR